MWRRWGGWSRQVLTLLELLRGPRGQLVAALLQGRQQVAVVGVQVVVEAQEVKLGVPGLLGLQHDLKLRPLLAHKVGRSLDDVVSLDGGWLKDRREGWGWR